VIEERHTGVQSTLLVRTAGPVLDPWWSVEPIGLEDLVLAYMARGRAAGPGRLAVVR
jgi:ABC-2 type transport system ATP-binding protein